jgi:hypothetical protein
VSDFEKKEQTKLEEIAARTRRLETRMTRFLELHGHVLMVPPQWLGDGVILIHDEATPIGEIMRLIPPDWDNDHKIVLRRGLGPDGFMAEIYLSEEVNDADE